MGPNITNIVLLQTYILHDYFLKYLTYDLTYINLQVRRVLLTCGSVCSRLYCKYKWFSYLFRVHWTYDRASKNSSKGSNWIRRIWFRRRRWQRIHLASGNPWTLVSRACLKCKIHIKINKYKFKNISKNVLSIDFQFCLGSVLEKLFLAYSLKY